MHREDDEINTLREFGKHLRQLWVAQNLTQEELAAKAGFSRSYYSEIEAGKRNISLLNLRKLAHYLDVPIHRGIKPVIVFAHPTVLLIVVGLLITRASVLTRSALVDRIPSNTSC